MRVFVCKLLAVGLGLIVATASASAQQPAAPVAVPVGYYAGGAKAATGCNSCGTTGSHAKLHSAICIGKGTEMPPGCACFAAQRSFVFGSCNQFFNPGNDCNRCGFGKGGCNNTRSPAGPVPPCTYSTYLYR